MRRLGLLLRIVLFATAVAGLVQGEGNPAAGTWKLNAAKSKYGNGSAPKSATRTVEMQSDGIRVSYEQVEADGSSTKYSYAASFDEKDYPISGSGRSSWRDDLLGGAETIAVRRAGSNAYAGALKKSGNVVMTSRTVVSKNGQVTTVTASGADAKGQPTTNVIVWEKQ